MEDRTDAIFIQGNSLRTNRTRIYTNVGNLIESPCYYTKLTVFENLKYLDIIHKKGNKRIDEVLEMVDLHREKKKKTNALSMGMKQRLGIAMAIFHDPQLLILDEPLNGLDPQGIVEMRNLFCHLNEQGKTIFLSSHILSELEKIATHIGIIEGGKMIFQGTKHELLGQVDREVFLRTSNPAATVSILQNAGFSTVKIEGENVAVTIGDDLQFGFMIKSLVEKQIDIYGLESRGADLEQIFINLIARANG